MRRPFRILLAGALLFVIGAALLLTQPFVSPLPSAAHPAPDPERLKAHVIALSRDLPPRDDDPARLGASADYIARELAKAGEVRRERFEVFGVGYENVSLRLGPAQGERVIVGAHYDTYDGKPGADDNASGVAGLLELSRLLRGVPLDQPVELIAYALEEPPYFETDHMGSAVHARRLSDQKVPVRLMLSLEMIGYFDDTPGSQGYPLPLLGLIYPRTGNFIGIVGNLDNIAELRRAKAAMLGATSLPVRSISAPDFVPGIDLSDHSNFWDEGYPALMITDTAFYRNRAYHTDQDRWDRLDYRRMAEVVKGVYGIVSDQAARREAAE